MFCFVFCLETNRTANQTEKKNLKTKQKTNQKQWQLWQSLVWFVNMNVSSFVLKNFIHFIHHCRFVFWKESPILKEFASDLWLTTCHILIKIWISKSSLNSTLFVSSKSTLIHSSFNRSIDWLIHHWYSTFHLLQHYSYYVYVVFGKLFSILFSRFYDPPLFQISTTVFRFVLFVSLISAKKKNQIVSGTHSYIYVVQNLTTALTISWMCPPSNVYMYPMCVRVFVLNI